MTKILEKKINLQMRLVKDLLSEEAGLSCERVEQIDSALDCYNYLISQHLSYDTVNQLYIEPSSQIETIEELQNLEKEIDSNVEELKNLFDKNFNKNILCTIQNKIQTYIQTYKSLIKRHPEYKNMSVCEEETSTEEMLPEAKDHKKEYFSELLPEAKLSSDAYKLLQNIEKS